MENTTSLHTSVPNFLTTTTPTLFLFSSSFLLFCSMLVLTFLKSLNTKSTQFPLPPGPKPWPIVGCLPMMVKNRPVFRWIHQLMKELDTDIACIRLGNVHVIPVTCPTLGCQFLKDQDSIFASRPLSISTRIATNGYLTTALTPLGEQWKKMKKVLVSEMLAPAKHKFFYGKRIEEANYFVQHIYNLCTESGNAGGVVNIRHLLQHNAGNLIRNIVFSKRSFGVQKKNGGPSREDEEHVEAIFEVLNYIYAFCVSDFMPCLVGLDLDGHEKAIKEAIRIIRKFQDPLVEQRIEQWSFGKKKEVDDVLDFFITLKDPNGKPLLTKKEVQAQIIEIMIEVIDNPTNAVEWALAEMINQPDIMAKAIDEIDRVVGKERLVEESDFSQLNYVKACARESFRLHPLFPFNVPHVATTNAIVGNYFIPKGSHVLLSRRGLGRNPKVWDDPERYNPERHLQNNEQVTFAEPALRFISFSTGKRACPGLTLGSAITVMQLARLLQGFTWTAPFDQTTIDLSEATDSLALAKPLTLYGVPRLPTHHYHA